MRKWLSILLLICLATISLMLTVSAQDVPPPDVILVEQADLFPAGIVFDTARERFLLSSLAQGSIFTVSDTGVVTPLIEDPMLVSSVRMVLDDERNQLIVASADRDVLFGAVIPGLARVAIYDLDSGDLIDFADLTSALMNPVGEHHFAYDVAVDADGAIFVTDSLTPVIYRFQPDPMGIRIMVDVFADVQGFAKPNATLFDLDAGLKGVVFHPDGYLLAAYGSSGTLIKIPLDNPEAMSPVALDEFISAYDVLLHPDGHVYVVGKIVEFTSDGSRDSSVPIRHEVLALNSDDNWASATIVGRAPLEELAMSIAIRDDDLYAVYTHLDQQRVGEGEKRPEVFEITRIEFEEK